MLVRTLVLSILLMLTVGIRAQGCSLVKDIYPGSLSTPGSAISLGGKALIFQALHPIYGNELFKSDANGTGLLKDVFSGPFFGRPSDLTSFWNGSKVLAVFNAKDSIMGREPWVTDGTTAGTQPLKDIHPGWNRDSECEQFTACGNDLFFTAWTKATGRELWVTDGTTKGTRLVTELQPGFYGSNPTRLTTCRGRLYFFAVTDNAKGWDLWSSDSTSTGTRRVKQLSAFYGLLPKNIGCVGDKIVFSIGKKIMVSDGTSAGTIVLKDLSAGTNVRGHFTTWRGEAYFSADDGTHGRELWKTDLTANGTMMVADLNPGTSSSSPSEFTPLNGKLYFRATGAKGTELFVTDGTSSGSKMLLDLNPGVSNSDPALFTRAGNKLFFRADNGSVGGELFVTDGTPAGTKLFCDLWSNGHGWPAWLTVCDGILYFSGNDGKVGRELFRVDGTPGTVEHLGFGCGRTLPQLDSTDALIGQTLTLTGSSAPTAAGIVAVSIPKPPVAVPGTVTAGCAVWVDQATLAVVQQPAGKTWSLNVAMPNDPTLIGAQLRLQSAYAPVPLSVSNGLQVTIGK